MYMNIFSLCLWFVGYMRLCLLVLHYKTLPDIYAPSPASDLSAVTAAAAHLSRSVYIGLFSAV